MSVYQLLNCFFWEVIRKIFSKYAQIFSQIRQIMIVVFYRFPNLI